MEAHAKDTPTHRIHILQVTLNEMQTWITNLQARRNAVVEKIAKAKSNSKLSRAATINKQLDKYFKKLDRMLRNAEDDIKDAEDELNKARALFFELSDGEVLIPKTE